MPELPQAMQARFQAEYGLSAYDATIVTASFSMADYFVTAVASAGAANAKTIANWIMGELAARLNKSDMPIEASPIAAAQLAGLIQRIADNTISNNIAKKVFEALWNGEGSSADEIIDKQGLKQITDSGAIEKIIDEVLATNQKSVEEFRSGKEKAFNALVGQAMKATRGKANPQQVTDLLKKNSAPDYFFSTGLSAGAAAGLSAGATAGAAGGGGGTTIVAGAGAAAPAASAGFLPVSSR